MTLDKLKVGEKARIIKVNGEGVLRKRLLDMGLTPKTLLSVSKVAPFGDPIELFVRNFSLAIRKEEAKSIEIEKIKEEKH